MSISLAGWRRVAIEGGVMLVPPEPATGVIQILHRQPLRSLFEIAQHLAQLPLVGRPVKLLAMPRAITTDDGEHGAILQLGTGPGDREARRIVGVVFGDDWLSTVDGRVATPAQFDAFGEIVERLTLSLGLGLGSERWRRFFYQPPVGWNGLARFRADLWLAPGFPKAPGKISVFHARPEHETPAIVQHLKLFEELTGEYAPGRGQPRAITTASGMSGQLVTYDVTIRGEAHHASNVVLADGRYLYPLRLETDPAHQGEHTAALMALVDSIEPLPAPRQNLAWLAHWSE